MRRSMAAVAATMPNAEAVIAPGVGHGWNGEAPELFSRMIRAWLTGTPLPHELLPLLPALGVHAISEYSAAAPQAAHVGSGAASDTMLLCQRPVDKSATYPAPLVPR